MSTKAIAHARARSIALVVGVWGLACTQAAETTAPNLLLITIDTLRADRLSCYGGEAGVGDAICRLADTGTRFVWAFSTAPYTAPSIASVLTSRYPVDHGVRESAVSFLSDDAVTLAEVLKQHGYTTAAFVSNPVLDRSRHLQQGFDIYDQRMTRRERNRGYLEEREAVATTDATLAWARVGAEPPWFIWVHYQDPHGPYEPPQPGSPRAASRNDRVLPVLDDNSGLGGIPVYQSLPGVRDFDSYSQRYSDEIRYLDPQVERLVDGLDALGRAPAVIVTSDHGEAFGEDGYYFAHGHSVGLDQIRVPLLWRPPNPRRPQSWDRPVSGIDIAPTLLRVARIDSPSAFVGVPLPTVAQPVATESDRSDAAAETRAIYSEHRERAAVVVGGGYFARDRRAIEPGTPDPMSGGTLSPLPARTAELLPDGRSSGYRPASAGSAGTSTRAELLSAFIDRAERPAPRAEGAPTDEAQRERLRALGYGD